MKILSKDIINYTAKIIIDGRTGEWTFDSLESGHANNLEDFCKTAKTNGSNVEVLSVVCHENLTVDMQSTKNVLDN